MSITSCNLLCFCCDGIQISNAQARTPPDGTPNWLFIHENGISNIIPAVRRCPPACGCASALWRLAVMTTSVSWHLQVARLVEMSLADEILKSDQLVRGSSCK